MITSTCKSVTAPKPTGFIPGNMYVYNYMRCDTIGIVSRRPNSENEYHFIPIVNIGIISYYEIGSLDWPILTDNDFGDYTEFFGTVELVCK